MKIKNNKKTDKASKTVKVAGKIIDGVKTAIKTAKAVKTAVFNKVTQAYRVWKRLDVASYKAQGQGTIANLRSLALKLVKERGVGQSVILHRGELGYGYTHGKLIDSETIHTGLMQIKFDKAQIVATFKTHAEFVKYVQKHGELNVSGTEQWRTLSNGGRYSLYSNGKAVIRFESSGKASGTYQDFQRSGKFYGKFSAVKH